MSDARWNVSWLDPRIKVKTPFENLQSRGVDCQSRMGLSFIFCQYQCNWLLGNTVPEMTYYVLRGILSHCLLTPSSAIFHVHRGFPSPSIHFLHLLWKITSGVSDRGIFGLPGNWLPGKTVPKMTYYVERDIKPLLTHSLISLSRLTCSSHWLANRTVSVSMRVCMSLAFRWWWDRGDDQRTAWYEDSSYSAGGWRWHHLQGCSL